MSVAESRPTNVALNLRGSFVPRPQGRGRNWLSVECLGRLLHRPLGPSKCRQFQPRPRRQRYSYGVASTYQPTFLNNCHNAGAVWGCLSSPDQRVLKSFLEAVDKYTGGTQSSQFNDGLAPKFQCCAERKVKKIESLRRNVFAEIWPAPGFVDTRLS
jgi:hypothetical protein